MLRIDICKQCEHFSPTGPGCKLWPCCDGQTATGRFIAAIQAPGARCPHPDGDQWFSAEAPDTIAFQASVADAYLLARTRQQVCNGCEHNRGRLDCAVYGGNVRPVIGNPEWDCPDHRFSR